MTVKSKSVEKYVFGKINNGALFDFHIKRTIYYAKLLAKKYKVDQEKAVIGALMHDIDGIIAKTKNDFKNSQIIAGKILKDYGYSPEFINEIQRVILTHSSGSTTKPKTILEKIIANADALSHFEMLPLFFYHKRTIPDFQTALKLIREKLERSWKKITLGEAKRIGKPLYNKAKEVLKLYKF